MKSKPARLRCFVASAFNRSDVDQIYDNVIVPVLDQLRIDPSRVDRHEHNDDIDDKIFELLNAAHFCIADLSYARPSVYYEAGYAFGNGKPVIYMARGDHFKARVEDVEGNLRVHFDLQMKNIIPWTTPTQAVRKSLRSRIRKVIAPLLERQARERVRSEAASAFQALAPGNQLQELRAAAWPLLKKRGYQIEKGRVDRSPTRGVRSGRSYWEFAQVIGLPALQKSTLDHLPLRMMMSGDLPDGTSSRYAKRLAIIISLRGIRDSTISQWLPYDRRIGPKVFLNEEDGAGQKTIIIDRPASVPELEERLAVALDAAERLT